MYVFLKGIAPRNPQDPERKTATSSNGCQASTLTVEARGPTTPSEIAQRTLSGVRVTPGFSATVPIVPSSPPSTPVPAGAQEIP